MISLQNVLSNNIHELLAGIGLCNPHSVFEMIVVTTHHPCACIDQFSKVSAQKCYIHPYKGYFQVNAVPVQWKNNKSFHLNEQKYLVKVLYAIIVNWVFLEFPKWCIGGNLVVRCIPNILKLLVDQVYVAISHLTCLIWEMLRSFKLVKGIL